MPSSSLVKNEVEVEIEVEVEVEVRFEVEVEFEVGVGVEVKVRALNYFSGWVVKNSCKPLKLL